MARITIDDIAAEIGVSRQTVSRAMNGKPDISAATREKVFEASRRLGYKPSRFASNLARSRPKRAIGFVVESFRNPFYSELVADLLERIDGRDWQVVVSSREGAPDLALVGELASDVDVIVGYLSDSEVEVATAIRGTPVILVDRDASAEGFHTIRIDFDAGMAALIDGLRERGAKHIGLLETTVVGRQYHPSSRRRAFESHVDADSRQRVVVCEAEQQSASAGADGIRQLLKAYPDTDTVIAFSDLMAMGALSAAASDGLRVPQDVRIVGIDGLSLTGITSPPLSSLEIVGPAMSQTIIEIVEQVLLREASGAISRSVVPVPRWRGST